MFKYLTFLKESNNTKNIIIGYNLKRFLNKNNDKISQLLNNINSLNTYFKDKYPFRIDIDLSGNFLIYKNQTTVSKIKLIKLLNRIFIDYKKIFEIQHIKPIDIETFSNAFNSEFKSTNLTVEIWKGEKILDAFNYNNQIDLKLFGTSCANFNDPDNGYPEPEKNWYDIYIENPNNINIIVVIDKNTKLIKGRRLVVFGNQYETNESFIKNNKYAVLSNFYGVGGDNSKYDIETIKFAKSYFKDYELLFLNFYNLKDMSYKIKHGIFIVQLNNTKFKNYPPFDTYYVNFESNLLASKKPLLGNPQKWKQAYKTHCNINEYI